MRVTLRRLSFQLYKRACPSSFWSGLMHFPSNKNSSCTCASLDNLSSKKRHAYLRRSEDPRTARQDEDSQPRSSRRRSSGTMVGRSP